MNRRSLPLLLAALPMTAMGDHISGGFGLMSSAPFWTESSLTLQKGQFAAGFRGDYLELQNISPERLIELRKADIAANPELYEHHHDEGEDEDSHAKQADLHNVDYLSSGSFRAAYGITDNITVGFRLPFIYRANITEVEAGHGHGDHFSVHQIYEHGGSEGIGDMSFWGQYKFYDDTTQSASVILGFKAPTGETTNTGFKRQYNYNTGVERKPPVPEDHSARLETHLQPGSGSWDSSYGLAYGYDFEVVQFNTSGIYTVTTEGSQATDIGDSFNYNFAVSKAINAFTPCAKCSWNLILEANGEWRDQETRGDITINNSGGHTLYVSPGVRFMSGESWNVGLSFGYAAINDVNGDQSQPDYRVSGAFNVAL